MSIKIELTFSTVAEAAAFLAGHSGNVQPQAVTAQPKAEPKAKAQATTSAEKPAESKPSSASTASATAEKQAEKPVEYADLQKAVMAVVALGDAGKQALTEIAASFGLTTFKGSDASIWPDALAKINAKHAELAGA